MTKKLPYKQSLRLIITASLLSACGSHAPVVSDCGINSSLKILNCSEGVNDDVVPLVKADNYLCQSPADFLLSKNYIFELEAQLAKCAPGHLPPPITTRCIVDAKMETLYCSDGGPTVDVSLQEADQKNYLCVSPTDYQLLKDYRNKLLVAIAECKP